MFILRQLWPSREWESHFRAGGNESPSNHDNNIGSMIGDSAAGPTARRLPANLVGKAGRVVGFRFAGPSNEATRAQPLEWAPCVVSSLAHQVARRVGRLRRMRASLRVAATPRIRAANARHLSFAGRYVWIKLALQAWGIEKFGQVREDERVRTQTQAANSEAPVS